MKKLYGAFLSLICGAAFATSTPISPSIPSVPPVTPTPTNRPIYNIFSTTVDWEAVTGLSLHQYTGTIRGMDKKLVKQGLVLYYLDAFPCYGEAGNVRVWLSPTGKSDQSLGMICAYKPETVSFAWRNATADAPDEQTTGILTCPVEGDRSFTIDISKCKKGDDWNKK